MTKEQAVRRPPFKNRPWVTNRYYDVLNQTTLAHIDIYAYACNGAYYVVFVVTAGGKEELRRDIYEITGGQLDMALALPEQARPTWWTGSNARHFKPVHAEILEIARDYIYLPGILNTNLLCHYVKVYRGEPMAGLQNTWNYAGKHAKLW